MLNSKLINMTDVKSFLLESFRRLHFDAMPQEVRDHFEDIKAKKDFIGNMKKWADDFTFDPQGNIELPTLDDSALENLYNLFQPILQNMAANKDKFEEKKDIKNFINYWFGRPNSVFTYSQATSDADQALQKLYEDLKSHPETETILKKEGFLSNDFSFKNLLDGIKNQQYNKDPEFQSKLKDLIQHIQYYQQFDNTEHWTSNISISFNEPVDTWFTSELSDQKKEVFKNSYPLLLREVLKQPKIRDAIKDYDSKGVVKRQINDAIEATDWENDQSKDYIRPKRLDDATTLQQEIQKKLSNSYNELFRQFVDKRGRHRFASQWTEDICNAITKKDIKPTDGIDAILKAKDDIIKELKTNNAKTHFEWFTKTIKSLEDSMPDTFAKDPLKHGKKLQKIVSELIIQAVETGKTEEAKTSMEILSVMKYGYANSNTMDALAKETKDLSIFSDSRLSWNKDEGIQFVTNAIDKTARLAFLAAGKSLAFVRNKISTSGTKFKAQPNENLTEAFKTWNKDTEAFKRDKEQAHQALHNQNVVLKQDNSTKRNDLTQGKGKSGEKISGSFDPTSGQVNFDLPLQQKKQQFEADKTNKKAIFESAKTTLEADTDGKIAFDKYTELENKLNDTQQQYQDKNNELSKLQTEITNIQAQIKALGSKPMADLSPSEFSNYTVLANKENSLRESFAQLFQQCQELETNKNNAEAAFNSFANVANTAKKRRYETECTNLQNAENEFNLSNQKYENLQNDLDAFENAYKSDKELDDQEKADEEIINSWENTKFTKAKELMVYWDFLETGRMTNRFHLGQTRASEKLRGQLSNKLDIIKNKYKYDQLRAA